MLVRMKPPLPIPPLDPAIRAPPGQPPGLIPGLPPGLTMSPGLPPGIPGATSMVPGMVPMPTPVSSMAAISTPYSSALSPALNTQSGVRVDGILGINRAVRGRKRSVGVDRPSSGKRRRIPDKDQGMIDLAAAGGMTPHEKELSKIQPIILNFDIPPPKVSPPKSIEHRLAKLTERQPQPPQGAEGQLSKEEEERLVQEARRNVHLLPEQRVRSGTSVQLRHQT